MAALKTCKTCSKEVTKSAKVCPHCGAKLKMGIGIKVLIGIVGLIVLGAIVSATGGGKDSTSTNISGSANSSSQPAPAALSKEGVSSDVKIAVQSFETKDSLGDNQFSQAKAQGVFHVVKLSITNNQKDAITVDSNSFKLVDDQKREFSYSSEGQLALETSMADKKESFFLKKINPGITIEGYVVFDVPKDAKGFTLKARGGMTGKEIRLKVE